MCQTSTSTENPPKTTTPTNKTCSTADIVWLPSYFWEFTRTKTKHHSTGQHAAATSPKSTQESHRSPLRSSWMLNVSVLPQDSGLSQDVRTPQRNRVVSVSQLTLRAQNDLLWLVSIFVPIQSVQYSEQALCLITLLLHCFYILAKYSFQSKNM